MNHIHKQWRRSSLLGFSRRILAYLFGQCYPHRCVSIFRDHSGRLFLKSRIQVGDCFRERWECRECYCGVEEIY